LLEHHSSIVAPDDNEERNLRELACDRWDSPIIITTMVQFLETVISARACDLRKFHSMQDSVIIFDEIQSLPIHSIHLFNEIVSFLSKILNTTILLCTATQPLIGNTERRNLLLALKSDLIDGVNDCFEKLKRTRIERIEPKTIDSFSQFVFDKMGSELNCLVIVNTKKEAREIYNNIKQLNSNNSFQIFHLSTAMCSVHRFETLNNVKRLLQAQKKVVLISTQLIEAGVDISFTCVVRAMAGLDSITQAAGRCNRNGESQDIKAVYAVPLKNEDLDKLKDIKSGKENAERVIKENQGADYSSQEILNKFYGYYFHARKNEMDFNINGIGTIYGLLSNNCVGKQNYKNRTEQDYRHILTQAFDTASTEYSVINNNTEAVVVCYDKAESLINKYKTCINIADRISLIRKLTKYSVSLYRETDIKKLTEQGAISILDDEFGIKLLNKCFYSNELGVMIETDMPSLII
jgi:CRISPR-associated endonuclease/helicase Cas3